MSAAQRVKPTVMKTLVERQRFVMRKVQSLGVLVSESAFCAMEGEAKQPVLVSPGELGITFIGHSSFLVQIAGKNLLFDPVFASRLIALRRMRVPGVKIKDLPAIDIVLLSHAHMDHLNRPSLRRIVARTRKLTGKAPIAVVPWSVSDLVSDLGFSRVVSLEWWQKKSVGGIEATMTPAKHWGARFFRDTHRGFGGYVVRAGNHSLYHSGDSAYFPGFAEIGNRLHPDVALLPIGAYRPESHRTVHTSPGEALQAFLDLGARRMIPMHFGTFRLSKEPLGEPLRLLTAAAKRAGVWPRVCVLEEGDTEVISRGGGARLLHPAPGIAGAKNIRAEAV
jgi:L-ascorbate metabolism protein UlaG (beta-lactamase superfamily)